MCYKLKFVTNRTFRALVCRRIVLIALFASVSAHLTAQADSPPCIDLAKVTAESYNPGHSLYILEDPDGVLEIEDVVSPEVDARFRLHGSRLAPSFSYTRSTYWLRLDLCRSPVETEARRSWVLELGYPLVQDVEFFLFRREDLIANTLTGSMRPFTERPLPSRGFLFPLNLVDGGVHRIYLRVSSEAALVLPVMLKSHRGLFSSYTLQYWILGLYFGLVTVIALYTLVLYLYVRRRTYLYYSLYITMIGFFHLSLTGISFQFLWPGQPWWANRSVIFFIYGAGVMILVFAREILEMKNSRSWQDRFARGAIYVLAVGWAVSLFLPYTIAMKSSFAAYVVASMVLLVAVADGFIRRVVVARFLIAAWGFMLLGGALLSARSFGVLPHNFFTIFGVQLGSVLEITVLALAMAEQTRIINRERITAKEEALTDALTGLFNRRHFDTLGEKRFDEARRDNTPLSVIILDLDHFKAVNDNYGHETGDEVLRIFARKIRGHTRTNDHINRYGGEEFTVLLPGTALQDAAVMAENLRRLVAEEPFVLRSVGRLDLTMSLGVATLDRDESFAALLRRADNALYRAKESGRNCVVSD